MSEQFYEEALQAIEKLFSDTSISKHEAIANLNSLIDEIQIMIESLEEI